MKIGHYVPLYLTAGGIQSYVRRISEAQRERGHEVLLFECGDPSVPPSPAGVIPVADDVDLLRRTRALGLDVLHFHAPIFAPVGAFDAEGGPALVRTMHGHHAYCPSGSRFLARTSTPCPRRYTLAGCLWGHFVGRCGSVRAQPLIDGFRRVENEQKFLARCHTIAISQFVRTQMLRSGYNSANISVVYNPAPAARPEAAVAATASHPPRFLFLGRIIPAKGLRWLLHAAAQVHSDIHFEIIGDGPEKLVLRHLAHTLGLHDRVIWSDWLENENEVFARLAAAGALIFPSLWQEPAGLVTAEAAAAGRAVIASRVGAIPEYAAQLEHALLVEPGDVAGLASAIDSLASDSQHATRLGLAGWRHVAAGTLSLEKHLDQLEAIYAHPTQNHSFPTVQTT